jgi:hypothetical protein
MGFRSEAMNIMRKSARLGKPANTSTSDFDASTRWGGGVYDNFVRLSRETPSAKDRIPLDAMVTMPQKNAICRICPGQRLFESALANS